MLVLFKQKYVIRELEWTKEGHLYNVIRRMKISAEVKKLRRGLSYFSATLYILLLNPKG